MPACPVCETNNPEDAAECASCGKVLVVDAELLVEPELVPGLEQTIFDPLDSAGAPAERIAGLELTHLVEKDLPVLPETTPGLERTQLEAQPGAPVNWTAGPVELDLGRELDTGERTPAPEDTGMCPWCGAAATGLVCDSCGRRRTRFAAPERTAAAGPATTETILCPQCFSRVPHEPKCPECHAPLPLLELY